MKVFNSSFEQYEPSYIECDCGARNKITAKYCDQCGIKFAIEEDRKIEDIKRWFNNAIEDAEEDCEPTPFIDWLKSGRDLLY